MLVRHNCFPKGIHRIFSFWVPATILCTEERQHQPHLTQTFGILFVENYELMISGKGFNNARNKDQALCRFKFSETIFFGKLSPLFLQVANFPHHTSISTAIQGFKPLLTTCCMHCEDRGHVDTCKEEPGWEANSFFIRKAQHHNSILEQGLTPATDGFVCWSASNCIPPHFP